MITAVAERILYYCHGLRRQILCASSRSSYSTTSIMYRSTQLVQPTLYVYVRIFDLRLFLVVAKYVEREQK